MNFHIFEFFVGQKAYVKLIKQHLKDSLAFQVDVGTLFVSITFAFRTLCAI